MVCPKCDSWIPDGARRCPSCNELLRKKIEPVVEDVVEEKVVKKKKIPARVKEKPEVAKQEVSKTKAEQPLKRVETLHPKSTEGQPKPPFESIVVTMETPQKTPASPMKLAKQMSETNNTSNNIGTGSNNTNKPNNSNTFSDTSAFNTSNYTSTNNSNYTSNSTYTSQSYTPPSRSSYLNGVNKVLYCILAFFLGTLGIHKFYAKKHLMGVVYIILSCCGLAALTAILSIIDLVVALLKSSDAYGNIYF